MREAKGIEMEGFSPISRSEKKLYVEYMKHCLKEATNTPELAVVKRDVRKLEFLLKKYDRKKDPRWKLDMDREVTDISKSLEGNYFIATGKGMKEKETALEKLDR